MHRPFTRRQSLQNARFLEALAETGNARLAACSLGVHRSTYTKRRARDPAFAALWNAALAAADDALHLAGGPCAPEPGSHAHPGGLRTRGGELAVARARHGGLQLRRSAPGRMTREAEDAFLDALCETANIRLSAAAAGFAHTSLLARKRRFPAFAADLAAAAAQAPARIEQAQRETTQAAAREAERRVDEGPDWPPGLTIAQALQILGAPPLRLPGMGFPAKRKPQVSSAADAGRPRAANAVGERRPAGRPA